MKKVFIILFLLIFIFLVPSQVNAQKVSLYVAPSNGTFLIGSTFDISVFVDTKGLKINAVELDLKFPPDILQVTSPTAGESFVSEWLTPPSYSNTGGTVSFKGGIPGGIVTSAGLISTITFRAKAAGTARVEFLDSSKVLLADGKGTPVRTANIGGVYEISVPPPEGPKVDSPTHPDPDIWYSDPNPSFAWEKTEKTSNFSFSFSQQPKEIPDIVPEGDMTFKSYEGVADGVWYFHLRGEEDGIWGKPSYAQVKIDTTPPKKFKPEVDVYSGFVYFETEDRYSGIDHYEVSVTNLSEIPTPTPFFIEATSPYKIPSREPGKYRVIVRAYDRAGNFREGEVEFQKLSPSFSILEGKGIQIKGILLSWPVFSLILFFILIGLGYLFFYLVRSKIGFKKGIKEIDEALAEIKKVEEREKMLRERREKFEKKKEELEKKLRGK